MEDAWAAATSSRATDGFAMDSRALDPCATGQTFAHDSARGDRDERGDFCFTAAHDALFAHGWPHIVLYARAVRGAGSIT